MKLSSLLNALEEKEVFNFKDLEIKNITDNSKDASKGSLFVAICGQRFNGHSFIKEAKDKAAEAFVVEDKRYILPNLCFILVPSSHKALSQLASSFYGHPSSSLEIIGITGTNGKTTTVSLLYQILNACFPTAMFSTIGHRIGENNISTLYTTPHPLEIHRLLKIAKDNGIKFVVMEVSSHGLELDRVFGIRFKKAIFTNLTEDHLDFHKTWDNYLNAKRRLFLFLDKDCEAFVNIDDPSYKKIIEGTRAKVLTYALENNADFKGEDIKEEQNGVSFSIRQERIKAPLFGRYNVYNCLAAISAAISCGISFDIIKKSILGFKPPPGRLEVIWKNPKVVIDYAHSPDALSSVLKTCSLMSKRVILVFGCGGNREREKRPIMGRIASELASLVIVTSDNPRDEDPDRIIDEIEKGMKKGYLRIPDRRLAIKKAIESANPNDLILIAGKGHEEYQIIENKRIPFSDKEVALEILRGI